MENKYDFYVTASGWKDGSGWIYTQDCENGETTSPDWDLAGFAEWLTNGMDAEQLQKRIDDAENGEDVQFVYSTYRAGYDPMFDDDDPIFSIKIWASEAAKMVMDN